jgi:hypothetical protein
MKQRQRRQEEYDKKGNMKETSHENLTGDEPGSSIIRLVFSHFSHSFTFSD